MDLRDEHVAARVPELAATPAHVVAHRRLRDVDAVLVDQPPPDPLGRVALLARHLEVRGQPLVDQPVLRAELFRRPRRGRRLGGGTDDASACLTARRCTPWRFASALIDSPSRSWSRLICSNCSTLDPNSRRLPPRARMSAKRQEAVG